MRYVALQKFRVNEYCTRISIEEKLESLKMITSKFTPFAEKERNFIRDNKFKNYKKLGKLIVADSIK